MPCVLTAGVEQAMANVYRASYVMLHVRKTNRAAIGLYRDTLGFRVHETEKGYCACLPPLCRVRVATLLTAFIVFCRC